MIGWPTLRLRGDYLAIVTLGFGEIIPRIVAQRRQLPGIDFNLTNGPRGVEADRPPGFGERIHDWTGGVLPDRFNITT